jgi:peptidoglycan/LPS O-acetylase OafA/YrhL
VKILPAVVNNWLEWVGSISAAMFICHPIARRVFIPISYHGNVYGGFFLYILASIALAWVFREILKKI